MKTTGIAAAIACMMAVAAHAGAPMAPVQRQVDLCRSQAAPVTRVAARDDGAEPCCRPAQRCASLLATDRIAWPHHAPRT